LAWELTAGDAATIGKDSQHQGVNVSSLLENIEYMIDAFVHKRNCANLYRDEFLVSYFTA